MGYMTSHNQALDAHSPLLYISHIFATLQPPLRHKEDTHPATSLHLRKEYSDHISQSN